MIDPDCVMTHFNHICDLGGRLCGTASEHKALKYASNYLGSLNNGTLKFHQVEYDGWECLDSQVLINGQNYEAVPLPGCESLPANGLDLEIVDAGRGTPDDLKALADKIKGSAVLVTHEYMFAADHIHRSRKIEMAQLLDAAVFIIANPWEDSGMVSGDASAQIPAFGVSKKTSDALLDAAKQSSRVHFKLNSRKKTQTTQTLDWHLPPANRQQLKDDREIIVCAHIDGHVLSQSAMDNASGVAVALALSSKISNRQDRSHNIRILIFSAEERGLFGSQQYVNSLSDFQMQSIIGVLNLDCVAGSESLCAMTSGFDYLSTVVSQVSENTGIRVHEFKPLVPNSDHFNFAIKGIPALRLIAGFGESESRLRHVLTSADCRDLVSKQELENTLKVTESMISSMENTHPNSALDS